MALIRVEHVSKQYQLGNRPIKVLDDVTLTIEEGVFLAIAGPSGSGKSTLLNLIGCIATPCSGRIMLDEQDLSGRTPDELAGVRARSIGFVFQTFNLLPVLSAEENVEYPLLQFKELTRKERRERVDKFLHVVELSKHARHRPNELSGGQRQRVAIARALVTHPRLVLADEPTANLDSRTGRRIIGLMKRINREAGTTFVFSTHDKKVIAEADRLVRIEDGRIRRLGLRSESRWMLVKNQRSRTPSEK